MKGKPLTPSQIKEAKKLKTQGLTYREIADRLGISKSAVGEITRGTPLKEKSPKTYRRPSTQRAPQERTTPIEIAPEEVGVIVYPHRETAAELAERYQLMDYYKEQAINYYKDFHRLLDEHKIAEAEEALRKSKEAEREFDRLCGPR